MQQDMVCGVCGKSNVDVFFRGIPYCRPHYKTVRETYRYELTKKVVLAMEKLLLAHPELSKEIDISQVTELKNMFRELREKRVPKRDGDGTKQTMSKSDLEKRMSSLEEGINQITRLLSEQRSKR